MLPPSISRPALLVLLAAAVRALVAVRTPVPDRDAAHYLWMAERFRDGDPAALFATVFHPLFSALIGTLLLLFPSLDPLHAGQCVSGVASALAAWPLYAIGRRLFGTEAATIGALFFAVGVWFARHPADALSEGPFHLCAALAVLLLLTDSMRARIAAGLVVGLAFGLRPEALSLWVIGAAWLFATRAEGRFHFLLTGLLAAALTPLSFYLAGHGLMLTPKAAFNYAVGVGAEEVEGLSHYFTHFAKVPGALFEAVGYVALPLVVVGLLRTRLDVCSPIWLLVLPIAVQLLVVPLLRSHIRFLSGYGLLLLPIAGAGFVALRTMLAARLARPMPRWMPVVAFLLLTAGDWMRLPLARREDRIVERDLGRHLKSLLLPGQQIATEMPRLSWFAGLEPPPPRPVLAEEILDAATRAETRFVVVVAARTPGVVEVLTGQTWSRPDLPESLTRLVRLRGIEVLERPIR